MDEALVSIERAGGEVLRPKKESADFRDPFGNVLGLWENAAAARNEGEG